MILVMTASVKTAKINQLSLTDVEIRLNQYCTAIRFYIKCKKFKKIVYCDNSNYCYDYISEQQLAKINGVKLEILKFESNYKLVEKYGKGYGEGELIEYIMINSQLLKGEDYFYKVTGRLIVKNISKLVKESNKTARFNRNLYAPKSLDTRFWGINKEQYMKYLMRSHEKVNDDKGKYLEHCYKKDMERVPIDYKPFNVFPIIKGYSGTVGKKYDEVRWYTRIIYDMLCYFNVYNSEKGFMIAFLLYNVIICKKKMIDVYYYYLINGTN